MFICRPHDLMGKKNQVSKNPPSGVLGFIAALKMSISPFSSFYILKIIGNNYTWFYPPLIFECELFVCCSLNVISNILTCQKQHLLHFDNAQLRYAGVSIHL